MGYRHNYDPNSHYIRIMNFDYDTPAFQSLSCTARCLLLEFDRRFDGRNNGRITLPIKEAARRLHVGSKKIQAALLELKRTKFIVVTSEGSFAPGARNPALYELTTRPINGHDARTPFRSWRDNGSGPKRSSRRAPLVLKATTDGGDSDDHNEA